MCTLGYCKAGFVGWLDLNEINFDDEFYPGLILKFLFSILYLRISFGLGKR